MRLTLVPALLTTLVATVALAGPASADTAQYQDPTGDVMVLTLSDDSEDTDYAPNATPNGDIISSHFTHSEKSVSFYVRYREIYVPKQAMGWVFDIASKRRKERLVALTATANSVGGRASMLGGRCKVASKINYQTNSVLVKFPRRCLGNPSAIRVKSVTYTVTGGEDQAFLYYDDPMRRGGSPEQVGATGTRWIRAS